MELILPNSRDTGNKFLFGHFMMRPKGGAIQFTGPGYGRVNYWMHSLEHVEADMIEMKKQKLTCYVIEFCGRISIGDGCWDCCSGDQGMTWDPETNEVSDPGEVVTNYFKDPWYAEAKEKYKRLIKLCQKYNMWLLNIVFNDNRWQDSGMNERLQSWIHQYPTASEEGGSSSVGAERPNYSRKEELRLAISHSIGSVMPAGIPSPADLDRLMTEVILPAGGKERIAICPVNEPETADGIAFERKWIPLIKARGYAACSYGELKYNARFYQGGHDGSVASVTCPKGFGVSDSGELLCELYGSEELEAISETDTALPEKVKTMITNYKRSKAKAAFLYAWIYNSGSIDKNAINAIKEGWHEGSS